MEMSSTITQKKSPIKRVGSFALKLISVLLATLIIVVTALLAVMWVLARGPSPTAQRLFVMSVKETSAVGFLANIYLSDAEIESILRHSEPAEELYSMDTSLISIPAAVPVHPGYESAQAASDDNSNLIADGIERHEIKGSAYRGIMLVVHDPKRIIVSSPDRFGSVGASLIDMVAKSGAIAGINGGGFEDPDGTGWGGIPDGIVIKNGKLEWGAGSGYVNVIGFDADGILHVGTMTPTAAMNLGLQWACSFGPTLISNGVALTKEQARSGINPRTAIGQRADGAVLLLVVDGRQIDSLGATFEDLIKIFLDFGAVNAANLDGGSSTLMVINGEIVNHCASVVGPRPLPTAFLVI